MEGSYLVRLETQVHASSPEEACEGAWHLFRDGIRVSTFTVIDPAGETKTVDLKNELVAPFEALEYDDWESVGGPTTDVLENGAIRLAERCGIDRYQALKIIYLTVLSRWGIL